MTMDPRIARTRESVLRSTLTLLAESGFAGFTMEGVADVSGIAKSTIYRHWPTRLALVRDALEELNRQPEVELRGGPARAQVERLLNHLAGALFNTTVGACIPALIEAAEHHPEVASLLHRYSDSRRARLTAVLTKGREDGSFANDLDPELAALALSGPIFYRRLMTREPVPSGEVSRLMTMVLGPG